MLKSKSGFTIVELLIVIVVIGILATITIVAYNGIQARAQFSKAQSDMSSINKAIQIYYADTGKYPSSTSSCQSAWCGWDQVTGDSFIPGLSPTYMQTIPQMPASNGYSDSYIYQSIDGTSYRLMRFKDTGLPSGELTGNPLISSPGWSTSGWGYKSNNATWT